jgi:HEAT repeat protein
MLVFAVMASIVSPALAQEESERDRKKNAAALYSEGLRAETEKPVNLLLSISKYALAVKHAKDEKNNDVAAAALVHTGWCNEKLDPANIAGAKAAYEEVVSSFADTKPWGEIAKEKASYKGVDVHLKLLHSQLDAWRVTPDRSPLAMADKKKAVADQILAGKAESVPGLIWGLGHPDEVIRDFAADCLAQITDEPGITAVIAKLNDANPLMRAGASAALQKIYLKFNDSADLIRRAQELERDLATVTLQAKDHKLGELADAQHKKLADEAAKLRAKAAEIRAGIPENLATADIQTALQKILEDENAHAQARRESAVACRSIGRISGALVDALLKAMASKDHNVREAACRAAGGVDTTISTDKIKLADRLILTTKYEPAKACDEKQNLPPSGESKDHPDWANDEAVRQASAEALEQIALVKTLPALIKALDDNDSRVRGAAFRALNRITNRDFEYEKDDKGLPKTYEPDKPLPERKKAQEKWQKWWDETQGVVVLVERFWAFQSQWSQGSALRLFDPALLLKELESKKWSLADPKIEEGRVKREIEEFQRKKDVFVQDAVDIGVPALDQLIKFIGGQTEREPKANAATRSFVAEAMARIIEKNNAADAVAKLKDAAGESDAARAAGGCTAIGFLPKGMVDAAARDALQSKGLSNAAAEVKEAAANSLAKVGEESSAADLTRAAADANQDVQIAALRALANIHPKNADTVKALGDMVADEPAEIGAASKKVLQGAKADQVREYATTALGDIGDPAAAQALLRARRDTARNVREAATVAIQKVYKADGKALVTAALAVFQSEKNKTDDRSGAALLLGDTGEAAVGRELAERLIDKNPPRALRDSDSGVRIKICEALGNLKAKTKSACETGLLKCMADEYEREAVRDAAFQALSSIFAIPPDDKDKQFKASDPKPQRDAAIQKWKEFLAGQGLKDEA